MAAITAADAARAMALSQAAAIRTLAAANPAERLYLPVRLELEALATGPRHPDQGWDPQLCHLVRQRNWWRRLIDRLLRRPRPGRLRIVLDESGLTHEFNGHPSRRYPAAQQGEAIMPSHVTNGTIHRPDPAAPTKRWLPTPIAASDQVAVHDAQPKLSQPFKFANGSTLADFTVGASYWMRGTDEDGNRVWQLTLTEVRAAGQDVMLVGNLS